MRLSDVKEGGRYVLSGRQPADVVTVYRVGISLVTQTAPGVAWRFDDGRIGKGSARSLSPAEEEA